MVLLMDTVGGPAGRKLDEKQPAVPVPSAPASNPESDFGPPVDDARLRRSGSTGGWWSMHRGALGREAIVALGVGTALLLGAFYWDDQLADRQDRLARQLANRQDRLAGEQADRAEVLENTRFIRQLAIENAVVKPLASLNLQRAELGGLDLACEGGQKQAADCADLTGANLAGAKLSDANLAGANLSGANLSRATLIGTSLVDANLSFVDLSGAYLPYADLSGADLSDADLYGANASFANLSAARLSHANLSHANLAGANLAGANLAGANLADAKLDCADLSDAGVAQTQIDSAANGDASTVLPPRVQRPTDWPTGRTDCPRPAQPSGLWPARP